MLEDFLLLLMRLIPAIVLAFGAAYAVWLMLNLLAALTQQQALYPFRDTLTGMVFGGVALCWLTAYCAPVKLVIGGYLLWTVARLALRKLSNLLNDNCWMKYK